MRHHELQRLLDVLEYIGEHEIVFLQVTLHIPDQAEHQLCVHTFQAIIIALVNQCHVGSHYIGKGEEAPCVESKVMG